MAPERARDDELDDAIARDVLRALSGAAVPLGPPFVGDDDDDHADARARACARRAALLARVEDALAAERAPVRLHDGSSLAFDHAHKILVEKEAERPFAPLSATLTAHAARGIDAARARDTQGDLGEPAPDDEAQELLTGLTRALEPLLPLAKDVVVTLGRAPWRGDTASLTRALALPVPAGAFLDERGRALLAAPRDALAPLLHVPVRAKKIPRLLAPLLVVGRDEIAFGIACTRRVDEQARLLECGARALAHAVRDPHPDALGLALALALQSAPVRRHLLDEETGTARDAARVAAATRVLTVATELAMARAVLEMERSRAALDEGCAAVLGAPVPTLVDQMLAPALDGWPAGMLTRTVARARALVGAAFRQRALVDALDEMWPLAAALVEVGREIAGAGTAADVVDVLAATLE